MGHYHGILALLAATVLGVNGGPCKPKSHHPHRPHRPHSSSSTVTLATTTTSRTCEGYGCEPGLSSSSSTITVHISETTFASETTTSTTVESSVTESASVSSSVSNTESASESTTASVSESTTASVSDSTTASTTESVSESTTAASSTITSSSTVAGPPPCVETQLLVNGGFDDNNDGSPWVLGTGVTISQVNPRSPPNFLYVHPSLSTNQAQSKSRADHDIKTIYNTMNPGLTTTTFSQTLPALGAFTYQLNYYINLQTAINGRAFSCSATPSINSQVLSSSETLTANGPYGFRLSSQFFTANDQDDPATLSISITCSGSFAVIIIGADDFSLTRVCAI